MAENFALANRVHHLIVQPSDAALDPPESYLFVQDGLIISCGVIYALCYLFCMIRAYSDRTLPGKDWGSIQFLCASLSTFSYIDWLGLIVSQRRMHGLRTLLRLHNNNNAKRKTLLPSMV